MFLINNIIKIIKMINQKLWGNSLIDLILFDRYLSEGSGKPPRVSYQENPSKLVCSESTLKL